MRSVPCLCEVRHCKAATAIDTTTVLSAGLGIPVVMEVAEVDVSYEG